MSGTFNAGAIVWRLQTVGAEVFQRDLTDADRAVKQLGGTSETAAKKVAPVGEQVDKTGQAAKRAKAPLDETAKSTKKVGDESDTAAPKVKKTAAEIEKLKRESDAAARTVGVAAVGIGAAVAGMAALTVAKFAEFDKGMSGVSAATHAPAEDIKKLSDAAIQAGADTAYSATEAADAETELSKAGLTTSEILSGSLKGSLSLAAAGQLGVARSAEIAATTLKQFNLSGKETEHVADLLAAGAGKAQGSVDDLAGGLEYVGPVAAGLNVSLEETVGTLALFAEKGQIGQKAGTGLRGVIQSLVSPSQIASSTMKEYGVNVFDAQGKFIGLAGVAAQLKDKFGTLTDAERSAALGRIFGNEQITAANILYQGGAEAVEKWTKAVDDSGYAADTAARLQDNLAGDIEKLGGSLDTALIQTGSAANDTLRDMVQILTHLIDWYGQLDPAVQGTALVLGVGTAAVLLLGGTMLLAVPKIAEFKLALQTLNTTMKKTALAGGGVGLAITAVIAVLAAVAGANADAAAKTEAYGDTLDTTTKKITASTREMVKANLAAKGSFFGIEGRSAFDAAESLGIGLDLVTDAATGNVDALKKLKAELAAAQAAYEKAHPASDLAADAARDVENAVKGESGSIEEAIRVAQQKASVDGTTTDSNKKVAASYDTVTDAVDGVITSVSDLAKELDDLNGKSLDSRDAARKLEQSYRDFDAALEENGAHLNKAGTDLDITTEKGATMQAALDDIAQAALDSGQAIADAGGSYDDYEQSLQSSRDSLLTRINDLGITGQAAQDLADKILHIPSEAEFKAIADTAAAEAALQRVQNLINGIGATSELHVSNGAGGGGITKADGGKVNFYANGGRENHIAQFARAGTMRVWAEPETGGEWYIPAALGKRQRSTQVLAAAASEFGYQLVPAGVQRFAQGGSTHAPVAPRAGATVNVYPQPGMSEETIGRIAAAELNYQLRSL